MEAIPLLSRYNTADALAFTQKRLDAALMGMQTLKSENRHLTEQLRRSARTIGMMKKKYNTLHLKFQKHIKGGKVSRKYRIQQIRDAICYYFRIPEIPKVGGSRAEEIRYPRQVYMYLAYTLTPATLNQLARELGTDHTTVMSGKKRILDRIEADAAYDSIREDIEKIKENMKGAMHRYTGNKPRNRGKAVEKLDDEGNVIASYPSQTIAAQSEGFKLCTLNDLLRGKSIVSSIGIWRFKNDNA